MKRSLKTLLTIVALASIACLVVIVALVVLRTRPDETDAMVSVSLPDISRGPSFEVRVGVPRLGRPLGGILPDWLVGKLDGTPSELRFDHTSSGARIETLGQDRVELKADDWNFVIETDAAGRIISGTCLVFPLALGGRHLRLSCRPADRAIGSLSTATRAGSDELGGRFIIELATCENADTGNVIEWPPAPLTVRGNFVGRLTARR